MSDISMADCPSAFVSSDVSSDGIEVGVSDLLKLCRVKDPDTQKRRIENIRRDRIVPTTLAGLWGHVINLVIRYGGICRYESYLLLH